MSNLAVGWIPALHRQSNLADYSPIAWEKFKYHDRPPSKIQLGTSSGIRNKFFHDGENTLKIS